MTARTATTRRMGVENSETRAQLIEAAGKLLRKEGCAAVTGSQHPEARPVEIIAQNSDDARLVVHDENSPGRHNGWLYY